MSIWEMIKHYDTNRTREGTPTWGYYMIHIEFSISGMVVLQSPKDGDMRAMVKGVRNG